jgi:hypothetical protein
MKAKQIVRIYAKIHLIMNMISVLPLIHRILELYAQKIIYLSLFSVNVYNAKLCVVKQDLYENYILMVTEPRIFAKIFERYPLPT